MSAEIDEYPSLRFQDIRKKPASQMDTQTDRQTDRQHENSIPPSFIRGIKRFLNVFFFTIHGHRGAILFNGVEPFEQIVNTPLTECPLCYLVKTGQAEETTFKDYMILCMYIVFLHHTDTMAILINGPWWCVQIFNPLLTGGSTWNLRKDDPMVSENHSKVEWMDRWMDKQTSDHNSSSWAFGYRELKNA